MNKRELRKEYRARRIALPVAERIRLDDLLLIQLQKVSLPFVEVVLTYSPSDDRGEPNVQLITDYLSFINPGLTIAYPRIAQDTGLMKAMHTDEWTEFEVNAYGIEEPVSSIEISPDAIDLVIVPLLAFDKSGYRVGYGKGHYDRFLSAAREDCLRIGCSYFEPVDRIDDANEFDVPLDLCITPQATYVF